MPKIPFLPTFLLLAACASFPEVDARLPQTPSLPPSLLPLDQLLASVPASSEDAEGRELMARASALQSRADSLRRRQIGAN